MQGLMQNWPLTVDRILDHAKNWHPHREIVSRSVEGPIVRTTYGEIYDRSKRLSNALRAMGVQPGDRVATLAWNTARHLECWYGIMGIGAVCHTLNPRLFAEQLVYIINHAEDRIIFTDLTFVPILEGILSQCPSVEHVVILTDDAHSVPFKIAGEQQPKFKGALVFESLIAGHSTDAKWGGFDENTAAGLCYTSGTTGNPKGVLYSHRSNFLHTLVGLTSEVLGNTVNDVILPVVPLFHANAWGLAFNCPAVGAKLVLPGAKMDGPSIYELLETEKVTFSAAVPTVWQMLLAHLDAHNLKLSTLKRVTIGGSAVPEAIMRGFQDRYGVEVVHAWGMTETSPLGTICRLIPEHSALPYDEQIPHRMKQGRAPLGLEMKLTNDAGEVLPHDGHTFGRLKVRGPYVAGAYFKGEGGNILDDEGYFDTGDVATICPDGYMTITDRAKDVIKSGGEWISSIEIENIAAGHPKAAIAAVIGVPHPKWDERPLLLVKLKDGQSATPAEFLGFLDGKIAKWWMPDDVAFVDDIPLGATGKIDKKVIRKTFENYVLPSVAAATPAAKALSMGRAPVIYAPDPEPGPPEVIPARGAPGEPEAAAPAQAPSLNEGQPLKLAPDLALETPVRISRAKPFSRGPMVSWSGRAPGARTTILARRALVAALILAVSPVVLVAGSALLVRFGALDWRIGYRGVLEGVGYNLALLVPLTGVLGLVLASACGIQKLWKIALANLVLSLAVAALFVGGRAAAEEFPQVSEAASDWSDPLTFSIAARDRRGLAANPVNLHPRVSEGPLEGQSVAQVNRATCPAARPVLIGLPPDRAFTQARAALGKIGVSVVFADAAAGRIEGVSQSGWVGGIYGFKDDITVRVQSDVAGSRIDMRSTSRERAADLGANCARIGDFARAIAR